MAVDRNSTTPASPALPPMYALVDAAGSPVGTCFGVAVSDEERRLAGARGVRFVELVARPEASRPLGAPIAPERMAEVEAFARRAEAAMAAAQAAAIEQLQAQVAALHGAIRQLIDAGAPLAERVARATAPSSPTGEDLVRACRAWAAASETAHERMAQAPAARQVRRRVSGEVFTVQCQARLQADGSEVVVCRSEGGHSEAWGLDAFADAFEHAPPAAHAPSTPRG